MTPTTQSRDVRIVDFPETRVAVLEHRGDPALLDQSIQRFIALRKQHKLYPSVSATFNIVHGDPNTLKDAYRLDLCAATDRPIPDDGLLEKTIPGGRCAVLRHVGSDATLGASISYLYDRWLPESSETPRDFPLFMQRVHFFPEVPKHEMIIDVFLPLATKSER